MMLRHVVWRDCRKARIMRQLIIAGLSLAAACFLSPADARVQRIEIVSRQAFAAGTEFGHAGAYEKLRGRAFFALDPDTAANGPIADLKLAPRNDRGLVEFSAEFLVCDPPTSLAATARFCTRSTTAAISPFSVSCTKRPPTMIRPPQRMPATVFCFDRALPWCGRRGLPTSPRRRATIGWCCVHRSPPRTARRSRGRSPTS